jgi:hypothetical protein
MSLLARREMATAGGKVTIRLGRDRASRWTRPFASGTWARYRA